MSKFLQAGKITFNLAYVKVILEKGDTYEIQVDGGYGKEDRVFILEKYIAHRRKISQEIVKKIIFLLNIKKYSIDK